MVTPNIDSLVHEAYDNACINGFKAELDAMSDDQLAADMVECGGLDESLSMDEIVDSVRRSREKGWKA